MRSCPWIHCLLAVLLGTLPTFAAQGAQPANNTVLTVKAISLTRYPSMEPETAIRVSLASPTSLYDMFANILGPGPDFSHEVWNCTKASSYKVTIVTKTGGSLKDVKNLPLIAVIPEGLNDDTPPERWTYCRPGAPGTVDLVIGNDFSSTDTLRVS